MRWICRRIEPIPDRGRRCDLGRPGRAIARSGSGRGRRHRLSCSPHPGPDRPRRTRRGRQPGRRTPTRDRASCRPGLARRSGQTPLRERLTRARHRSSGGIDMAVRVGINGFGRIGRQSLKALLERAPEIEVVAVNDLVDVPMNALLFAHDSTYGNFDGTVTHTDDAIVINGKKIKVLQIKDPTTLPWGDLGVDIVIESTGIFTDAEKARAHITAGAKKVLISAPAKGEDITIVLGVNEGLYDSAKHTIISNASCTTNCLAPFAKVLNDNFGIEKGVMNTIHSYTNDQKILDVAHKDPRRARSAGLNMIPTTTGAAKALALVIPELKGKVDGFSLRLPTPTVSIVDFAVELRDETTAQAINEAFRAAAAGPLKGILGVSDEPVVSMDFRGDSRSSIVDSALTMVIGGTGKFAKVLSWYDNEWGYSSRVADLTKFIDRKSTRLNS